MALTQCKECGTQISKKAPACPSCGAPNKKKTSLFTWLILLLVGSMLISSWQSAITPTQANNPAIPTETPEQQTTRLLAELKTLPASEYKKNQTRYQQLTQLHPNNTTYQQKLKHYTAKVARQTEIEKQFSAWDGSHKALERYIKSVMHNPDSYEHIETRYTDKGDYLYLVTTYRGSNAFGAIIKNQTTAKYHMAANQLEILP